MKLETYTLLMKPFGNLIILFCFFLNFFNPTRVMAHGEATLGPNGGFIRMPGAFHTELVQTSDHSFKVFLLDIDWKNPTTANSAIEAKLRIKRSERPIACEVKASFYECTLSKGESLKSAKAITLKAKREKMQGALVIYALPLKLSAM